MHVRYEPHELLLEVSDDGVGAGGEPVGLGGGHGLVGMRERVALYGGDARGRARAAAAASPSRAPTPAGDAGGGQ